MGLMNHCDAQNRLEALCWQERLPPISGLSILTDATSECPPLLNHGVRLVLHQLR